MYDFLHVWVWLIIFLQLHSCGDVFCSHFFIIKSFVYNLSLQFPQKYEIMVNIEQKLSDIFHRPANETLMNI